MKKYIILYAVALLVVGCNQAEKEAAKQRGTERMAAEKARISQWAHITKEKQITPTETVKLVIIPSALGDVFDTKCLIYTNSEYKQSNMVCGEIEKYNFAEEK